MRNFINYFDNSLISLEEENSRQENKTNKKRKNANIYKYSSSNSFFTKLINSVSKIGQGLKNIMSIKINIENDDNYNQNIYEQVSNRFNINKEISLIDSPSLMEESLSNNKYILKNRNKFEDGSIIDNEDESKMIISHNETKRDNNDTENLNINNTISKYPKIENINTDILRNQDDNEIEVKSTFLNKKRENNLKFENLLFEEEKNEKKNKDEDEEIISNKKKSFIKPEKSFYSNRNSITNTNKNEKKSRLNSSIMSLSMKSLDNIKDEINQRREENLRSIEEMQRRHGLNYDSLKERQLREKILNEYYKEKEKRNNEERQQLEREKKKREEEFQKLKIKKVNDLKFNSKMKKPMILSKTNGSEIKFLGTPIPIKKNTNNFSSENSSNNLNLTFGAINNNDDENQNNLDKKDNNDNKPLFGALTENKKNENEKKIIDNKKQSIFGDLIKDNNNQQEKKIDNKQNTETKKDTSLFSGSSSTLFSAPTTTTTTTPSLFSNPPAINNIISTNKKEEKQNTNENENEKYNPFTMDSSNVTFGSGIKNEKQIFSTNSNDNKKSIFFANIKTDNKIGDGLFGPKKEEGSLFNQQTSVSKSINETSLFTSNQAGNKDQNQKSLLNKENPFLSAQNTNPIPNIFGNTKQDNNNQNNQQTQSLFGNMGAFNMPLFGTNPGKGLFN